MMKYSTSFQILGRFDGAAFVVALSSILAVLVVGLYCVETRLIVLLS
jgi:hypothetical protein